MKNKNRTSHAAIARLSVAVATAQADGNLPDTIGKIKRFISPLMDGVTYNDKALVMVLEQFGVKIRRAGRPKHSAGKPPQYSREIGKVIRQVVVNIESSIGCAEGELFRNGVHESLVQIIGGRSAETELASDGDETIDVQKTEAVSGSNWRETSDGSFVTSSGHFEVEATNGAT